MLLDKLINSKPVITLFFIVFCLIFFSIPLINTSFYNLFNTLHINYILVGLSGLLIPSLHAVGLNNLIYENNVIKKNNLIIAPTYLLLTTPFLSEPKLWICGLLLLFFLINLLKCYQKDYPLKQLFNAGSIIAILSMISPITICLFVLILVAIVIFSNPNWRLFVSALLGLSLPYLFLFSLTYCLDWEYRWIEIPISVSFSNIDLLLASQVAIFWYGALTVLLLFSFFELFSWLYKKSIRSRKSFIFLMIYFSLTIVISLFSDLNSLYLALTPATIIMGNYLIYSRNRKFANFLFIVFLVSSFYYRYTIVL